jgi:hypothetical protein
MCVRVPASTHGRDCGRPPGTSSHKSAPQRLYLVNTRALTFENLLQMDGEFMHQVTLARQKAGDVAVSLFSDPWYKLVDQDGVPYYYNFRSDEISFERPPDSRERAAVRIQARARGIQERATLERKGFKVKRLEADKESVTKQRLMMQLTQLQLQDELAKDREDAMKARLAEEAARQEEKRLRDEAREQERQRVEAEKAAMLEQLRQHQEKQNLLATKLQGVYRAHMVRKRVELPHHRRDRVVVVLQGAFRAHRARAEHAKRIKMKKQAQLGRKKVAAMQTLQRVYRGHVGRRAYGGVRAAREAMRPEIEAATCIKCVVLRYLYRSAYRATIYELERRARQFELALCIERQSMDDDLKDQGLWQEEAQRLAQDSAQDAQHRDDALSPLGNFDVRRQAHSAATDSTATSIKPRTAHMLDTEDAGDAEVMVFADSRPHTEYVTRPSTQMLAAEEQIAEGVEEEGEGGQAAARPQTQYTAPEGAKADGHRIETGDVLVLDDDRSLASPVQGVCVCRSLSLSLPPPLSLYIYIHIYIYMYIQDGTYKMARARGSPSGWGEKGTRRKGVMHVTRICRGRSAAQSLNALLPPPSARPLLAVSCCPRSCRGAPRAGQQGLRARRQLRMRRWRQWRALRRPLHPPARRCRSP